MAAAKAVASAAFRPASTLVLAVGRPDSPVRVAMLRRAATMRFMPGAHVFPGGAAAAADEDAELWAALLAQHGAEPPPLPPTAPRPPLWRHRLLPGAQPHLPADAALRIAALREAFEEAGVLLATRGGERLAERALPQGAELRSWRARVRADPRDFAVMHSELRAAPDLGSLVEWNNWLTPCGILPFRFDTAFYLAAADSLPAAAEPDGSESLTVDVVDPLSALEPQSTLVLHPPQHYELARLGRWRTVGALYREAAARQPRGLVRCCPELYEYSDGRLCAMPGDEMHRGRLDSPPAELPGTLDEATGAALARGAPVHRTLWYRRGEGQGTISQRTNLTDVCGTGLAPPDTAAAA
eukprot:TRINITY_DN25464_c0_g1_i1.p2 TRINITY_DN25464_c0_g1~~TRINITY_DN25464_c0_g1_i1.p2  ORF type:complete len:379 (+),score=117.78 TRINITY_DN25464_c0_g1_i1:74-1138(+)